MRVLIVIIFLIFPGILISANAKDLKDKAIICKETSEDTNDSGEKIYVSNIDNWTFDEVCTAWLDRDSLKPFLEDDS